MSLLLLLKGGGGGGPPPPTPTTGFCNIDTLLDLGRTEWPRASDHDLLIVQNELLREKIGGTAADVKDILFDGRDFRKCSDQELMICICQLLCDAPACSTLPPLPTAAFPYDDMETYSDTDLVEDLFGGFDGVTPNIPWESVYTGDGGYSSPVYDNMDAYADAASIVGLNGGANLNSFLTWDGAYVGG